jgi:hypothetical protein
VVYALEWARRFAVSIAAPARRLDLFEYALKGYWSPDFQHDPVERLRQESRSATLLLRGESPSKAKLQ